VQLELELEVLLRTAQVVTSGKFLGKLRQTRRRLNSCGTADRRCRIRTAYEQRRELVNEHDREQRTNNARTTTANSSADYATRPCSKRENVAGISEIVKRVGPPSVHRASLNAPFRLQVTLGSTIARGCFASSGPSVINPADTGGIYHGSPPQQQPEDDLPPVKEVL
jgi:hypothetical protein